MQYRTVFDSAAAGYTGWHFASTGLGFIVIGSILVAIVLRTGSLPFRWWSTHPRTSKVFAFYILGFSVLWTVAVLYSTYHQYSTAKTARAMGTARVVEGPVSYFKPMPATGHSMEQFCVGRACFSYSDYVVTPGFHNTASHGGPIREGLPVKVTYFGDTILKLEVAE